MRRLHLVTEAQVIAVLSTVLLFAAPQGARAQIELVGVASMPGDATDLSGLQGTLEGGVPANRIGGISAIESVGENRYLIVADRGPLDGGTGYRCRFHLVELDLDKQSEGDARRPGSATCRLISTTLLSDEAGRGFVGATSAFNSNDDSKSLRFDPEGIRQSQDGRIFISDEYGPSIYEFSKVGIRLKSWQTPAHFHIQQPAADPADEAAKNQSGRQPNAGMEALAISPDGSKLLACMQRPLIQDSAAGKTASAKRKGVNNRMLQIDTATGEIREYVYVLDSPAYGVSEILAINDHQFLVLERDGEAGEKAGCKKIFKCDMAGATDVHAIDRLPAGGLPPEIKPASKSLFLDLLEPRFGLKGKHAPEKIEGLAFGPDLPDGRRLLVVAIDNDFKSELPILFYLFAVNRID